MNIFFWGRLNYSSDYYYVLCLNCYIAATPKEITTTFHGVFRWRSNCYFPLMLMVSGNIIM